ncbi:MAG: hypothetical protein ACYC2D_03820 [Thiobacillus sp.]
MGYLIRYESFMKLSAAARRCCRAAADSAAFEKEKPRLWEKTGLVGSPRALSSDRMADHRNV